MKTSDALKDYHDVMRAVSRVRARRRMLAWARIAAVIAGLAMIAVGAGMLGCGAPGCPVVPAALPTGTDHLACLCSDATRADRCVCLDASDELPASVECDVGACPWDGD